MIIWGVRRRKEGGRYEEGIDGSGEKYENEQKEKRCFTPKMGKHNTH